MPHKSAKDDPKIDELLAAEEDLYEDEDDLTVPPVPPHEWMKKLMAAYMQEHQITALSDAADRLGISRSTVYGLLREDEKGSRGMSVDTLSRLAAGFDIPAHELLYSLYPDIRGAENFIPPLEESRLLAFGQAKQSLRALAAGVGSVDELLGVS